MKRARRAIAAALAGSCAGAALACNALLGLDELTPAEAGAPTTEGDGGDDGAGPAVCDPLDPFGAPTLVLGSPYDEARAFLTADERTLYFTRADPAYRPGWHLFVVTRESRDAGFDPDAAAPLDGVNGDASDLTGCLSDDGGAMFFSTTRNGQGTWAIWRAARTGPGPASFTAEGPLPSVNGVSTQDPFLSADGGSLYVALSDDGVNQRIVRSRVEGPTTFGPPEPLPLPGFLAGPVESADGRVLYFGYAPDINAVVKGYGEIYRVRRGEAGGFADPELVVELGDTNQNTPAWLSPDMCRLYFVSSRGHPGPGNRDLWVAERSPRGRTP